MSFDEKPQQLHLNVSVNDDATFDNFYLPSDSKNSQVLTTLNNLSDSSTEALYYLWGSRGCGLSHLLHGACHKFSSIGLTSIYLPLNEMVGYQPQGLLEGIEDQNLVCLDDLDAVVGKPQWEASLFELFNQIKEKNHTLIVTSRAGPHEIDIDLPDLKSRFNSGISFQIEALNDADKLGALKTRAQTRGMDMSDEIAQFILNRASRSTHELFELLDQLDELSLSAKRRLTVPFLKEAFDW